MHAGLVPHMQRPPVHVSDIPGNGGIAEPHTVPQPPQLFVSDRMFAHEPLQHAWPDMHVAPAPHRHVPDTHVSPVAHAGGHVAGPVTPRLALRVWAAGHTLPQLPQLVVSVAVERHVPEQHVWLAVHAGVHIAAGAHVPAVHASPDGHARPQVPQFAALVCVFTQLPVQHVAAAEHIAAVPQRHAPPEHVSPSAHGGSHALTMHVPPVHTSPAAHARPHIPQSVSLDVRSAQCVVQHA
jgi:hypothetical protein